MPRININLNDESGDGAVNVLVNGRCNHADYEVEHHLDEDTAEVTGFTATCTKCKSYRYDYEQKWNGIGIMPIVNHEV